MEAFLGYFENSNLQVKTAMATFWVIFEKIGPLFISASGHTAPFEKLFNKLLWQFVEGLFRNCHNFANNFC